MKHPGLSLGTRQCSKESCTTPPTSCPGTKNTQTVSRAGSDGATTPEALMSFSSIELNVTRDCPLRCTYCYAGKKKNERMSDEVGKAAVHWILKWSGSNNYPGVHFFGGEPLMELDLIKTLVEYGESVAPKAGKNIHFGATTNLVLVTDEIVEYWQKHRMNWNTSIDGAPECHDKCRVYPDGSGSSKEVERGARKILAQWPKMSARWTLHPDNVGKVYESMLYLYGLGYRQIPMIPVAEAQWTEDQLQEYRRQIAKLSDFFIDRFRAGELFYMKHLDSAIKAVMNPFRRRFHCGAGRTLLVADTDGRLYPCNRFSGCDPDGELCLGHVLGEFDYKKRAIFTEFDTRKVKADCDRCIAVNLCGSPCVAANWGANHDLYKPNPAHCRLIRMDFEEGMRVHYVLHSEGNTLFMQTYYKSRAGNQARPTMPPQRSPERQVNQVVAAGRRSRFVGCGAGF